MNTRELRGSHATPPGLGLRQPSGAFCVPPETRPESTASPTAPEAIAEENSPSQSSRLEPRDRSAAVSPTGRSRLVRAATGFQHSRAPVHGEDCRTPRRSRALQPIPPNRTRSRFAALFAGTLLIVASLHAFPPTPHHVLFGTVRNEMGDPITIAGAQIVLTTPANVRLAAPLAPNIEPGANYRITVPMDAGLTADPYKPTALQPTVPFRLSVKIGQTTYLPIEMSGDFARLGQPAQRTRLDLTLGVDSDGDGLPDAWERALMQALGGNRSLLDIKPGDDSDGDGISNVNEYLAGTYAFDPADGFSLAIVRMNGESPVLEFLALRGRTYTIAASDDLQDWSSVAFRIVGNDPQAPLLTSYISTDVRRVRIEVPVQAGWAPKLFFKSIVD